MLFDNMVSDEWEERRNPMKKTTVKREVVKQKSSNVPKKTITSFVMNLFKTQPKLSSKEMEILVKKFKPSSAFNVYHYSYYKTHIRSKKGKYHHLFTAAQIAAIPYKGKKNK